MKIPKYISPSALAKFESNRDEYFLSYCADNRPPRMPQTKPMSVGSAFDAYVKAYISEKLFGEIREDFALEEMLIAQVEEPNREWAREAGKWCFDCYKKSGALSDLMLELNLAVEEPQFEFKVEGHIEYEGLIGEDAVKILGKPDLYFKTKEAHVIKDWKVNGYCAKRNVSPKGGYNMCRDGWDHEYSKHSRSHNRMHKNCDILMVEGVGVNIGRYFEHVDKKWADQLTSYGWLLGEKVGDPLIIGIEQLACGPGPDKPLIRVASHTGYVSRPYQEELYRRYTRVWKAVHSGHIFTDLSYAESCERQDMLGKQHLAFDDQSDVGKWYTEMMRKH